MMQKNDTAVIEIIDIGVNGEGIGKVGGYTLFVKDAVIGDQVEVKVMKAKKNYGYAKLMRILEASVYRTEPRCRYARQCGGCQIQEMAYGRQLVFKEQKVREDLERIGGVDKMILDKVMEPIAGMEQPFGYRNKAQFPFGTDKSGEPYAGFYAGRTHDIIANTDCALGVPVNRTILEIILDFMKKNGIRAYNEKTGDGLIRHVLIRYGFATDEIMVCLVINGGEIPNVSWLVDRLKVIEGMTSISVSVNTARTNVIMGDSYRVLWGQGYITDCIGEIKYQISPLSFYQVNPVQTETLYSTVLEYADLNGSETVWDLYCGIGTISLFLAQRAKKVYGVEIIPQAIEDARENARINGINNVEFFVGRAEEVLPEYCGNSICDAGAYADVIVVDPPRKGCDSVLLDTIVKMQPEKIIYVSCDPATLARDVKMLCGSGYEVKRVRAVDMFPMTVHVETCVLLGRKKSTENILYGYVDVETKDTDYLKTMKGCASYAQIKEWIEKEYGLKVSSLYVAQIKDKLGIEKRENYNKGEKKARVPHCPPEKEEAIIAAFKHFKMI